MRLELAMLKQAGERPQKVAVADENVELTYAQLAGLSAGVAKLVSEQCKTPVVGIALPTVAAFPVAFYGGLLAGKTVVPVNFLLRPPEIAHVVKDSGMGLLIATRRFEEQLAAIPLPKLWVEDLMQDPAALAAQPQPTQGGEEVAVLLYTSGTTALPKGVQLTHANLLAQIEQLYPVLRLAGDDFSFLGVLPLFHILALTATLLFPLTKGLSTCYLPQFHPAKVLEALGRWKPNVFVGVPSMYRLLALHAPEGIRGNHPLTVAIAGGEPLPKEIAAAFEERFGIDLIEGYGMTEHSPVISVNIPGKNRPGTSGPPLPGVELRVVGEDGAVVAQGEQGELHAKSPAVMRGYHNLPDETTAALSDDGWLRTGDLARIDENGCVVITGRIKDLIISSGKNIAPIEIEQPLGGHPAVAECCAFGLPDKSRGEVPCACVVLAEGASATEGELREFLADKIADYKQPRKWVFLDELPRTMTGKVFKRAIREKLLAGRGE